ncbi:MAG: hypothetical protein H6559_15445 [Lewinellaceae bacterium]|nr:hypothetical protein [Lewinellaceae bacterium]
MKRGATLLILAFMPLFISTSCEDDAKLCDILEKADLTCDIGLSTASIILGESMNIINQVTNLIFGGVNALADCTKTAEASDSDVNVLYRESPDAAWEITKNFDLLIKSLIAGGLDEQAVELLLNKPGQYVFETNADVEDDVDERDENNNTASIGGRGMASNNYARSAILTVLPNPDYTPDPGRPQVEIISITRIQ